ncbi:hypothetical protein EBT31_07475 [bacterium]|nr:hypothetical protein [bacterium]
MSFQVKLSPDCKSAAIRVDVPETLSAFLNEAAVAQGSALRFSAFPGGIGILNKTTLSYVKTGDLLIVDSTLSVAAPCIDNAIHHFEDAGTMAADLFLRNLVYPRTQGAPAHVTAQRTRPGPEAVRPAQKAAPQPSQETGRLHYMGCVGGHSGPCMQEFCTPHAQEGLAWASMPFSPYPAPERNDFDFPVSTEGGPQHALRFLFLEQLAGLEGPSVRIQEDYVLLSRSIHALLGAHPEYPTLYSLLRILCFAHLQSLQSAPGEAQAYHRIRMDLLHRGYLLALHMDAALENSAVTPKNQGRACVPECAIEAWSVKGPGRRRV